MANGVFSAKRSGAFLVSLLLGFPAMYYPARGAEPFTEEAAARGLSYTTVQQPSYGVGVAFVDLDADGDPDIVAIGNAGGTVGLFENLGDGTFVDRSVGSGIPPLADPSAICAGDYNGDGKVDLYFTNWLQPNVLCRNEGGFKFTDTSFAAGVDDPGYGMGSTWGDFDGDGWLDLYVANRTTSKSDPSTRIENRLFRNRGNGTFEEVAATLGVDVADGDRLSLHSSFLDFDNDGDADLYLATDKGNSSGSKNHLFENIGGTFVDISGPSGAGISLDAMSIAIGDFDGNGYQDLFCTNTFPGHKLLLNNGNGTFTESAETAGVQALSFGWGAAFFDYDNDGYQDLYVCDLISGNQLYTHKGAWPATDVALAMGVADPGQSYGIAIADIDNDGDIDLLVQDNDEPLKLYINHEGELRNWVKFRVVGEGANRFAIGTQVRVRTGAVWQIREILAGGNTYKGQNEFTVHFGLGTTAMVDEAVITWPGGHTRTLTNLVANRTYQVHPAGDIPTLSAWGFVVMTIGIVVLATLVVRYRAAFPANAPSAR